MATSERTRAKADIEAYLADQFAEEKLHHLERVGVEHVAGTRYEIWDAHIGDERWWVVTNPMNYYSQADFKSRDVVLTFHIGLMWRVLTRDTVPISPEASVIFPAVWRRWEQAVDALGDAEQAEDFQAVGTHLRECLISFAQEIADDELVPEESDAPKAGDAVVWLELLAKALAPGRSNARLRHYLLALVEPTWAYQQTLLHKKNATRLDAEIGVASVQHLVSCFTAAILRTKSEQLRCQSCDGYAVAGICQSCGWEDPYYEPPPERIRSEEEIAAALEQPCTPSSEILTLMTVDEFVEDGRQN